jgi:hypothetical protein
MASVPEGRLKLYAANPQSPSLCASPKTTSVRSLLVFDKQKDLRSQGWSYYRSSIYIHKIRAYLSIVPPLTARHAVSPAIHRTDFDAARERIGLISGVKMGQTKCSCKA